MTADEPAGVAEQPLGGGVGAPLGAADVGDPRTRLKRRRYFGKQGGEGVNRSGQDHAFGVAGGLGRRRPRLGDVRGHAGA